MRSSSLFKEHLGECSTEELNELQERARCYDEYVEAEDATFTVASLFTNNMGTDDEWGWDELIDDYLSGSPEERRVIDSIFIHLSGYSLAYYLKETMNQHEISEGV